MSPASIGSALKIGRHTGLMTSKLKKKIKNNIKDLIYIRDCLYACIRTIKFHRISKSYDADVMTTINRSIIKTLMWNNFINFIISIGISARSLIITTRIIKLQIIITETNIVSEKKKMNQKIVEQFL